MNKDDRYYIPDSELLETVKERLPLEWDVKRSGIWYKSEPKDINKRLPTQGWKIHISATTLNYKEILKITLRICVKNKLTFKHLLDKEMLLKMNSKPINRGSSGKFITVYPTNIREFKHVLEELYQNLKEFEGPFILSDRRYKDSNIIYYRYGGIIDFKTVKINGERASNIISPDGEKIEDLRLPYWNPPNWVTDPISEDDGNTEDELTLKEGKYKIDDAIHFTNGGGIYTAINKSGKKVILKEARKWSAPDRQDNDFVKRLNNEYTVLKKLKDSEFTPKPIEIFNEWEHVFLVEEYIEGMDFGRFISRNTVLGASHPEYSNYKVKFKRIKKALMNIINFLEHIHKQNISFGDLSVSNIIVSDEESSRLYIIDLETAWDINKGLPSGMYTPGFGTGTYPYYGIENDIYSLGTLIISSFLPITMVKNFSRKTLMNLLLEIEKDLNLPHSIINTFFKSLDPIPENRPSLETIRKKVSEMDITDVRFDNNISVEDINNDIEEINNYIMNIADYNSQDTPFPTEAAIYLTNSLNVAYGACGIAYALMKINGEIPDSLRTWLLMRFDLNKYPPGLFVGLSGIAWTFWDIGMREFSTKILEKAFGHKLIWQRADVFYGASGYGLTSLHFYSLTKDKTWLNRAIEVGEWLINKKQIDDKGNFYWIDEQGNTYSGFANGASGIALFLLYLSIASGNKKYLRVGEGALNFDIQFLGKIENHYSLYRGKVINNEIEENVLSHYWFDGSAGVVTTLLRYYYITKKVKYKNIAKKTLPDCMKKYTSFPSLFRGLAGLGNVLLDAYCFLGDKKYLKEAHKVAQGTRLFKVEKEEGIIFPGDQLQYISTAYGTGSSGIALFLKRLVNLNNRPYNFNFLPDEILYSDNNNHLI